LVFVATVRRYPQLGYPSSRSEDESSGPVYSVVCLLPALFDVFHIISPLILLHFFVPLYIGFIRLNGALLCDALRADLCLQLEWDKVVMTRLG
jgi:hypothetical protein